MAEGFTTDRATTILSQNIKKTTYVGLSTTVPNKSGTNFTEPASTTGYARHLLGDLDTSIAAQVANNDIVFLFEALADCGSFTHIGLFDDQNAASKPFLIGQLTNAITVNTGYVPLIRKHKLVIGLDKEALDPYAD